ncbi:MAG: glycoside hydrolase family 1 protein [Proteobacteria bacterium]|nr:glycoside hydrolase family 1 protein [Pseudomonadota bacterium]
MRIVLLLPALLLSACPAPEPPLGEDFLWGTASAAWQVEGDYDPDPDDEFEVRSNWTVWAERGCVTEGQTNDVGSGFYRGYRDDFALAAALGNNTYRLTIDWTRIEPEDDHWNEAALDHYVEVLQAARDEGLTPMVTLWHWVMPTWVQNPTEEDGFDGLVLDPGPGSFFVDEFEEFVRYVAPAIGPHVDLYSILNEPFSVISGGYMNGPCGGGAFPPGTPLLDFDGARATTINLLFAQGAACTALREEDSADMDDDGVGALCGQAQGTNVIRPLIPGDTEDTEGAAQLDWLVNHATMAALIDGMLDVDMDRAFTTTVADDPDLPIDEGYYEELAGSLDWQGINYYGPIRVDGLPGSVLGGLPNIDVADYDPTLPHSTLGYAIDPDGLGEILDDFAVYGLPLYVTENGLGDPDGDDRAMFLVEHVDQIQAAAERGIDLRGYYHWSLTDNFEWAHGFDQRFGLYRVDFDDPDLPRTRTAGADAFEEVIAAGGITDAIRDAWVRERYASDSRP